MFWERFCTLCDSRSMKPNAVAKELGFGSSVVTHWKNGRQPNAVSRMTIAKSFGVSVEYLMGQTDDPRGADVASEEHLNAHEKKLIRAYREQPDLQYAVDRLLGIEPHGYVRLYTAAKSEGDYPDKIMYMRKDKWEKLKNTEDSDVTLM